jgi:hypothetical protein
MVILGSIWYQRERSTFMTIRTRTATGPNETHFLEANHSPASQSQSSRGRKACSSRSCRATSPTPPPFESIAEHVLTETLVSSQSFTFKGHQYDFRTLVPGGVTLHELFSNTGVPGVTNPNFPVGFAFAGNCLAVATWTRTSNKPWMRRPHHSPGNAGRYPAGECPAFGHTGITFILTNLRNMYIIAIWLGPAGGTRCSPLFFRRPGRLRSRISAANACSLLMISCK